MATVHQLHHRYEAQTAEIARRVHGLDGGGGGPHDPGMEPRVAKLESDVGEIKDILKRLEPAISKVDDRLRKLEVDVAEVKGRVAQMPTTLHLLMFVLAVLGIAGLTKILAP